MRMILVPEKYDVDISEELRNVLKCAENNKMQVNMAKTKKCVSQVKFQKCLISF